MVQMSIRLPARHNRGPRPGLGGPARVDRRTKDLTKRLRPGDVAVIDHEDLDRVSAEALVACKQAVRDLPEGTTFAATGIGRSTIDVMLASLSAGGHLRVGMEDTITYAKGQPVESNMQLVARAVGFARLAQRPPMTTDEAREMLGVAKR